jgi:adenylate kinase
MVEGTSRSGGAHKDTPLLIFVCGLSKSGKSHLVETAIASGAKFRNVKASELLRAAGRPLECIDACLMLANQRVFLESALAVLGHSNEAVVLEGHLVIETTDGPQLVPDTSLDALPISKLILIEDDPNTIAARRRFSELKVDHSEIADLMALERTAAVRFARRHSVELLIMKSENTDSFANAIRGFVKG